MSKLYIYIFYTCQS